MADKPADSKKVMDVSTKSSAPSETSRPVIVTKRQIVQDPMMKPATTDSSEASGDPEKKPQKMASTGKTLQPLGVLADDKNAESDDVPKDQAVEAEVDQEEPTTDDAKTKNTASEDDETKKAKEEAAIVDAVANQAGGKKKTEDEIKTDSAKQEAIAKLIEDKKYFLPIGEITKRKQHRQLVVVAAFIIVAVVGGYVALDMELVESPVELPFRFFN